MKQINTKAIILSRTNFGEADRIITVLTPDKGKLQLMARGVRKIKSKMAGGIELFSVSEITYIAGKGEIGTLISSRLVKHFANIAKDIDRVQLGYAVLKTLNRATEDVTEERYFDTLEMVLESLNTSVSSELIRLWFWARLLQLAGHEPNLRNDTAEASPEEEGTYSFDFDSMSFTSKKGGPFTVRNIKAFRLLFSTNTPLTLRRVEGLEEELTAVAPLMSTLLTTYIRV